jgi:hypothetical protein
VRRIFQAHVVNKDRVVVINRVDGGMGAIFVERFIANIDPIEVSQLMSQLGHFRPIQPVLPAGSCLLRPGSDQLQCGSKKTQWATNGHDWAWVQTLLFVTIPERFCLQSPWHRL